jgi:UDP:flavonoid glycosyltransferase YjiC (YdhE family)
MPFDDFDAWLAQARALITNSGYRSIQMALDAGVPVIVAGTGEDKKEAATRVAWSGCGIDLRTSFPSESQLRDAVRKILGQATYRQRTGMVREDFAAHDTLSKIARQVDLLVTWQEV